MALIVLFGGLCVVGGCCWLFLLTAMLKVEYINSGVFNMENGLFLYFFVQEGVYFNLSELR